MSRGEELLTVGLSWMGSEVRSGGESEVRQKSSYLMYES